MRASLAYKEVIFSRRGGLASAKLAAAKLVQGVNLSGVNECGLNRDSGNAKIRKEYAYGALPRA